MAQFNLTNWWVVFTYTVSGHAHVQKFQVSSPSTAQDTGANLQINLKGGTPISFNQMMAEYTAVLAPMFNANASSFVSAELWYQPDIAPDPLFLGSADTAQFIQPNQVASEVLASQATHTFRDSGSRTFKIVLLDSVLTPHAKRTYAQLGTSSQALADYALSNSSPFRSRAGNVPMQFRFQGVCYNDKLTRKRFNVS